MYDRSERVTRIIWRKPWLRKAHKFAGSDRYEVFMQSVIFGNMVMMIIEYMVGERAIESALAGDVVNHDGNELDIKFDLTYSLKVCWMNRY